LAPDSPLSLSLSHTHTHARVLAATHLELLHLRQVRLRRLPRGRLVPRPQPLRVRRPVGPQRVLRLRRRRHRRLHLSLRGAQLTLQPRLALLQRAVRRLRQPAVCQ
jgi:hypothetical protein